MDELAGGRYRLLERLGVGGTATVYRAEDLELGRIVAYKRFHERLLDDPIPGARVRAEVALSRELAHESIARVYGLVEDGPRSGIAIEYVSGGDLRRQIVLQGRLDTGRTTSIARALLEALDYAHRRGVVHRDVKPRNILFSEEGVVKLTDFGLARSTTSAGISDRDQVAGTPEYTAPETITATLWDARSDLYALGCTLYEALTGGPPFVANDPAAVLRMQVEAQMPELPREVSQADPALAILVATLLSRDPNDRPQTAEEARLILAEGGETSPDVRAGRASGERIVCPSCGASMSSRYPWCFACGRSTLPVVRARRGGVTVFVVGPGERGDKLAPELRDACCEVADALGLDSTPMRKRVPRLPFVFARELDGASATRTHAELAPRGLVVSLVGPGHEPRSRGAALIARKTLTMAPRFYLILAGVSGGMWQVIGRVPPVVSLAILGSILAGIPIVAALGYRLGGARLTPDQASTSSPELSGAELRDLLVRVRDPLVHARVRSIVEAAAGLVRAVDGDDEASDALVDEARSFARTAAARAAALGLALDDARRGAVLARHNEMLASGTSRDTATVVDSVAVVRRLDSTYTRALERLGSIALSVHQIALRLARTRASLTDRELKSLAARLDVLAETGEAFEELEAFLAGTPVSAPGRGRCGSGR